MRVPPGVGGNRRPLGGDGHRGGKVICSSIVPCFTKQNADFMGGCTVCCVKSRLFSTTGSHGSQGPEFSTLQPLLVDQDFLFLG